MPGRSKLRYVVAVWSIVLVGGYVFYVARGGSRQGPNATRFLPGSKSRTILQPSSQPERMILPSSKHAVIDGDVVYGDGKVTFEQNPFERPVTLPTTKLSTAPSVK